MRFQISFWEINFPEGRIFDSITLKICGNCLWVWRDVRVHGLDMDLSRPWSQGLRGAMHIIAAELECFYGEHLLFQQKCIQQAESIPEVLWGSCSHPKCCRPHTLVEGCCEERDATQPDYLTSSLTFPITSCTQPLQSPHGASPHLCPKRELQTAVSVPERDLTGPCWLAAQEKPRFR